MNGVQDAAFGCCDVNGLETAVVVRDLRADRALYPEGRVRRGVVEDDVDAPLALRRGARVVDVHLVAIDPDRDGQPDRLVESIRVRLVLVDTVRQRFYGLPHGALGAGADLIRQRLDVLEVELLDHLDEPLASDVVAPRLGVQVADHLEGRPHVGTDDPEELLVGLAADEQAGHGHEESLLVDLARVSPEAATPDVEGVAAIAEVRDDIPVAEDRGDHGEVVEVARGLPRVIGDHGVALLEGFGGDLAQEVMNRGRHRVHVAWRARYSLGYHAAPAVEEAC